MQDTDMRLKFVLAQTVLGVYDPGTEMVLWSS